ncbi:MAG TPA: choice-of-anchor P family protein [Actinomycetota bacterium]
MKARFRSITTAIVAVAALTTALFGASAQAQAVCIDTPTGNQICIDAPIEPNPLCDQRDPQGEPDGRDPLCPNGPAECIAYGMYLATDPTTGAPAGATSHLARSHAQTQAGAWNGYGFAAADSDASTQRADVPPALGEGVVESSCRAVSYSQGFEFGFNEASGTAETARLHLDLGSYGVPVALDADVLREQGHAATGFVGSNSANIADVTLTIGSMPPIVVPASAAPNTAVPLPLGLGTLYLNEQFASFSPWGCAMFAGDALRLVLNRPGIGGQVTLILSWVANAAC